MQGNWVLYKKSWIGEKLNKKIVNYNIYNINFKYIGGPGRVRQICDCYDPNPT